MNVESRSTSRQGFFINVLMNNVYPEPPSSGSVEWSQSVWTPESVNMVEHYTPNSEGSRHLWKSFQHYKSAASSSGDTMTETSLTSSRYASNAYDMSIGKITDPYYGYATSMFGEVGEFSTYLPSYLTQRIDGGSLSIPSDINSLKQRSLDVMLPQIKSELSLLNSLYELKDLASLSRYVSSIHSWLISFLKADSSIGTKTLQQVAESYLQYGFNLRPLLSDIKALCASFKRAEKRMRYLVSQQGRALQKHFNFSWAEHTVYQDETSWVSLESTQAQAPSTIVKFDRLVIPNPTIFHAEIEYNYNYSQFQAEHARLLAILDSLGVNFNPAIIWNAIKWTFLIDWVINVSRWLDQFKFANMEPQINIRRYLWSFKRARSIFVNKTVKSNLLYGSYLEKFEKVALPSVSTSAYERRVEMPSISSIELSGLNSHEFSLGAALVYIRRTRSKH